MPTRNTHYLEDELRMRKTQLHFGTQFKSIEDKIIHMDSQRDEYNEKTRMLQSLSNEKPPMPRQ